MWLLLGVISLFAESIVGVALVAKKLEICRKGLVKMSSTWEGGGLDEV